jgi:uncharacterized protein (DUF58 family)
MNSKTFTLTLIILGLLFTALITRNGDLAWMVLPFLVYLGIGILQMPSVTKMHLEAVRSVEKEWDNGHPSVEVHVDVSNRGTETVQLNLYDKLQPGMRLSDGQMWRATALRAGEMTTLEYTFRSERGSFAWETVAAAVSDPLGLIKSHLDLPAEARVQVQPELNKFRPLPLHAQRTLHSAGSIPARLGGSGIDFWGVREYHPGDPLRRLDWRLTARHPRQFFTKEFEQEEIADIGLILDARRKIDLMAGQDNLFEHSVRATTSLAEGFLRQGNRVSLLVHGKTTANVYPGYGKVQLNRILSTLAQTIVEEETNFNGLQFISTHMFTSHSLIIVISPLARDDWMLFSRLRAYNYQVLLISPDPIDFVRRTLPTDANTRLATRLTWIERQQDIARITQLWIPVIDWQVDQPLSPLVRKALYHAHIQRER